ncbi:MAG: NADH-quinone oxidoreductase subunit D [Euryarchaeota archaeon]|nr:NADH-quinone oxidoreductase subunit D [Euryarchaeota archaeon]MDE1835208.1 NADH-quinone oxidoreductase subunit D [Euryarchaeota archaeon]MDE1880065.1 NADH-quinone oxidoreductase subunit D [Euryarchaeota archaeon]MDE2043504.1 NADH-quinone oxidoreductase subunit D [Thermoplasmata archaeon]
MSEMWINMGPQHPMTHGLWNLRVKVDGELVIDAVPEMGYLHRGIEKICEYRRYNEVVTLMDRCCYVAGLAWEQLYLMASEQALGVEVPERAEYIRVMCQELQRLASHLMWYAAFVMDVGLMAPFGYGMRDRDIILDLFQSFTGARMTYEYMRVGGVRNDLPVGFTDRCRKVMGWLEQRVNDYEDLCDRSDIFLKRCIDVGVLKAKDCIRDGITGPMLRAAGVARDLRRDRPYSVYPELDFQVAVHDAADVYGRYRVRMEEMRQSLRIVRQCLDWLDHKPGRVIAEKVPRFVGTPSPPPGMESYIVRRGYPKGVGFSAMEEPHGEALAYVVNEGGEQPYRVKFRSPVMVNISAARDYLVGYRVSDIPAIMGSVDICVGESDR